MIIRMASSHSRPPRPALARKSGTLGLLLGVCLAAASISPAFAAPSDNIDFGAQTGLKECIIEELGLPVESEITEEELSELQVLRCDGLEISDISLLTLAPNLDTLRITDSGIIDISPIASLHNLTFLDLSHNAISDISALAGLTSILDLELHDNRILDISPLRDFAQLDAVTLHDQRLTNVLVPLGVPIPSPVIGLHGEPLGLEVTGGDGIATGTNIVWESLGPGFTTWEAIYPMGFTQTRFAGNIEYTVREHHEIELSGTPSKGVVGKAYSYALTLVGTPSEPTVSVTAGALPAGLTLSTEGIIAGTPTTEGAFTFTVTASNGVADDVTKDFTIVVNAAAITPSSGSQDQLANTGAEAPIWAIGAAALTLIAGAALTLAARRKNS